MGLPVVAGLLFSGCETESVANNDLRISPSSVGLYKDQYADFTASGGYEYTWSLENPTWGVLSSLTGPTTRYTDRYDPGSNGNASVVQVLTVTSVIQSGSSSNGTAVGLSTGTAQIEHLATAAEATNTTAAVSISPSSADVHNNSSAVFTASGGSGGYSWSLSTTAYGGITINTVALDVVTYTRNATSVATNETHQVILYVTDSDGALATTSINIIY